MAKFLVTGGAGFIGSNIVEKLVGSGHTVRVVDNLSTGKMENINEFVEAMEFIEGDLTDYDTAKRAVDGMEYVLHQAALSNVPLSIENPVETNNNIVTTAINLLKASVECKTVRRFVQASSSSVYGNDPVLPKREDMKPEPISPYAAAKLAMEYYGKVFYDTYGLQVFSLRYFNVFGPRQDANSFYSAVIPKFVSLMEKGQRPMIYGDGSISRDFIYVDNVVEANLSACFCEWTGKHEIINIGSGEAVTLNELVGYINEVLGTKLDPLYDEPRLGDINQSVSDISKAKGILDYKVQVGFYDGLVKLINRV